MLLNYLLPRLQCDFAERCHTVLGGSCAADGECPAGAACRGGWCRCLSEKAAPDAGLCAPDPGLVGAACGPVLRCTAPGAACVNGTCRCPPGVAATRLFTCQVRARPALLKAAA